MSGRLKARAATETIFALSSGTTPSAIAIVRISGPEAASALRLLAGTVPAPRRAVLRTLRDGDGEPLDHALILWFPGPQTVTGEDLAELHLHGGRAVVAAVLAALDAVPECRAAKAGEFTRRAFLNGRIDLTAAEGLADLLAAETEGQRRAAMSASGGALAREIEGWRVRLLEIAAQIEASLDFGDDEVTVDRGRVTHAITALSLELRRALDRPPAERLRDGIRMVLAGPPNAGKSTLLNVLAGRDAAITSPIAGTTRDRIEAPVAIGGVPFVLIDTAGLRRSADMIEALGIARAEQAMADADILLWLGDDPPPVNSGAVLWLHARADAPGRSVVPAGADLAVSAGDGESITQLVQRVLGVAAGLLPREGEVIFNQRQRALLSAAAEALSHGAEVADEVVTAEQVRTALHRFDEITGRAGVEDMLDALFGAFCIGK